MRVARLTPRPRVTFVAEPGAWLHVPQRCDWAESNRVEVLAGDWERACAQAASTAPEITFLVAPSKGAAHAARELPGLRIAVTLPPAPDPAAVAALCVPSCSGGYDGITWFETPPPPTRGVGFVQVVPPVIDVERTPPAPHLDCWKVVAPASAPRYGLEDPGGVAWIANEASSGEIFSALSDAGVFACWSERRDARADSLVLAALACGLLVVSNRELPGEWGIEPEDDYLVRREREAFATTVGAAAQRRGSFAPVRVRGWQKVRESLSATSAFERLAHDALLALAPAELAARSRTAEVK